SSVLGRGAVCLGAAAWRRRHDRQDRCRTLRLHHFGARRSRPLVPGRRAAARFGLGVLGRTRRGDFDQRPDRAADRGADFSPTWALGGPLALDETAPLVGGPAHDAVDRAALDARDLSSDGWTLLRRSHWPRSRRQSERRL